MHRCSVLHVRTDFKNIDRRFYPVGTTKNSGEVAFSVLVKIDQDRPRHLNHPTPSTSLINYLEKSMTNTTSSLYCCMTIENGSSSYHANRQSTFMNKKCHCNKTAAHLAIYQQLLVAAYLASQLLDNTINHVLRVKFCVLLFLCMLRVVFCAILYYCRPRELQYSD